MQGPGFGPQLRGWGDCYKIYPSVPESVGSLGHGLLHTESVCHEVSSLVRSNVVWNTSRAVTWNSDSISW